MKLTKIKNGMFEPDVIRSMNVLQLRTTLLAINKLQIKFNAFKRERTKVKETVEEACVNYMMMVQDFNTVEITNAEINSRRRKTIADLRDDIRKMMSAFVGDEAKGFNLIHRIEYSDGVFTIKFINEEIENILAPGSYSIVDLDVLENLQGTTEIALYLLYRQYVNMKHLKISIGMTREYFKVNQSRPTGPVIAIWVKACEKINAILGYNAVSFNTERKGRTIKYILFTFKEKKQSAKQKQKSYKELLRSDSYSEEDKGITYEDVIRNNGLDETDYSEVF